MNFPNYKKTNKKDRAFLIEKHLQNINNAFKKEIEYSCQYQELVKGV